jgi:hypothetical protein
MLIWTFLTAVGGPVNDMAFVDLTQTDYAPEEISEV